MLTDTETRNDLRFAMLCDWLRVALELPVDTVVPASADASFRRYFRVHLGEITWIAMDAPPDREDSAPFVRVARLLAGIGVPVPQIRAVDLQRGFLLLSDLGAVHLLGTLQQGAHPEQAYAPAMAALLAMHTKGGAAALELPPYDAPLLRREMALFPDWFLDRHLGMTPDAGVRSVLERVESLLVQNAVEQPQVLVHRDFHSRNLMVSATGGVGVIDFQDAVRGAVTYDLVSLYKDCYIAWPRAQVTAWVESYRQQLIAHAIAAGTTAEFLRWFDWMGLQRHLKVLGIFARLWYRDGKRGYLADLPLVLRYVLEVTSAYKELAALDAFLIEMVVPRFETAQSRVGVP
ncbi:MAG: phosphotransferase [Pseudomonadota bacterium]|jgi:aminoglycoside/choline kinase family phosphotransferase